MNYKYTTTLKKIRSLKKKIRAIVGGTSAGKTISILMVLIDKCIKTPKLEVSVVGESIPSLRRGALKDWEKIMKDTNRWIEGNFNKSTLKYTFTNGSYIEFFSVDDETRIRGARRDCLFVNEANNISYDAYLQLSIRTIGHQYLDWNPSHKFWYYTELQGRDDVEEITLTYKDNEALSPEIVKQLESYREKALTSTYWSNWVATYNNRDQSYIAGMCNFYPNLKDRFVFLNLSRCNNDFELITLINHELLHQSFYLFKYDINKEEDIISWAEMETSNVFKWIKKNELQIHHHIKKD
jgi:phage terminase large subunit